MNATHDKQRSSSHMARATHQSMIQRERKTTEQKPLRRMQSFYMKDRARAVAFDEEESIISFYRIESQADIVGKRRRSLIVYEFESYMAAVGTGQMQLFLRRSSRIF